MKYQLTITLLTISFAMCCAHTTNWSHHQAEVHQHHHQHQHQSQHSTLEDDAAPQRCDYRCTSADLAVCATNGECMHQFQGSCQIAAHNCRRPQKPFVIIDDWKCEETWAPLCRVEQLGIEQV